MRRVARCLCVALAGINTGNCIMGDVDCDGTPSGSEHAAVTITFDFAALPADGSAPDAAVFDSSCTACVSIDRYGVMTPEVPDVTVTVGNSPDGPDVNHPHLELAVAGYSAIAAYLGMDWSADTAPVALLASVGSDDAGPAAEDAVYAQNLSPSASPSPSPSRTATATRSSTATATASRSVAASALCPGGATPLPNPRPSFVVQVACRPLPRGTAGVALLSNPH